MNLKLQTTNPKSQTNHKFQTTHGIINRGLSLRFGYCLAKREKRKLAFFSERATANKGVIPRGHVPSDVTRRQPRGRIRPFGEFLAALLAQGLIPLIGACLVFDFLSLWFALVKGLARRGN